jgi:hypothetical protein
MTPGVGNASGGSGPEPGRPGQRNPGRKKPAADEPERLYVITGGRSRAAHQGLELLTMVVTEAPPPPGAQVEHTDILRLCRTPQSIAELSGLLHLPVGVIKILLTDLIDESLVSVHAPQGTNRSADRRADTELLEKVLSGLSNLL